jgi:hypothetical protein
LAGVKSMAWRRIRSLRSESEVVMDCWIGASGGDATLWSN